MSSKKIKNDFRLKRIKSLVPSLIRYASGYDGINSNVFTMMADSLSIVDADLRKMIEEKWVTDAGKNHPFISNHYSSLNRLGQFKGIPAIAYELFLDENKFCTVFLNFLNTIYTVQASNNTDYLNQIKEAATQEKEVFEYQLSLYGRLEGEPQQCLRLHEILTAPDFDSKGIIASTGPLSEPYAKLLAHFKENSLTIDKIQAYIEEAIDSIPSFWKGEAWLNYSQHLYRQRLIRSIQVSRGNPATVNTMLRAIALAMHCDVNKIITPEKGKTTTLAHCKCIESEKSFTKFKKYEEFIEPNPKLNDMNVGIYLTEYPSIKSTTIIPQVKLDTDFEIINSDVFTKDRPVITVHAHGDSLYYPAIVGVDTQDMMVFGDVIPTGSRLVIYPEISEEEYNQFENGDLITHHDWIYDKVKSYAELRASDGSVQIVSDRMYYVKSMQFDNIPLDGPETFGEYQSVIRTPLLSPGANKLRLKSLKFGELPLMAQYEAYSVFGKEGADQPVFAFSEKDSKYKKAVFSKLREDLMDEEGGHTFDGHVSMKLEWWIRKYCSFKVTIKSLDDDKDGTAPRISKRLERPGVMDLIYKTIESQKAAGIYVLLDIPEKLPTEKFPEVQDDLAIGIDFNFTKTDDPPDNSGEVVHMEDTLSIEIDYVLEEELDIKEKGIVPFIFDEGKLDFSSFTSIKVPPSKFDKEAFDYSKFASKDDE